MSDTVPELRPCPFCGGGANYYHDDEVHHSVNCINGGYLGDCGATVWGYDSKENAYKAWNTRTRPTQAIPDKGVEVVARAIDPQIFLLVEHYNSLDGDEKSTYVAYPDLRNGMDAAMHNAKAAITAYQQYMDKRDE